MRKLAGFMARNLLNFADLMLHRGLSQFEPVDIYNGGAFATMILHRDPPFQAELCIMWPFDEGFGNDRHPHINAYECFLYGDIPFKVNGKRVVEADLVKEVLPKYVRKVDSTDWHTVDAMPKGGAFLSIQEWLDDAVMTSVSMDWEGLPLSKEQNRLLHEPNAFWKRTTRRQMESE